MSQSNNRMYKDGWRMLRDYFYDSGLTELSWDDIFDRYLPLVERCSKREEVDDVLRQMAGELSALHVFVYGGDYSLPNYGNNELQVMNEIASLGAVSSEYFVLLSCVFRSRPVSYHFRY